MAVVALQKNSLVEKPIRTSPPHPAAAILGPKTDAARAKFETAYRRAPAPEWLINAIACVAGLAVFALAWAAIAKFGGRIPGPLSDGSGAAEMLPRPCLR